ncbi:MAG: threonine--tRNA ligase [Defluviitaleaceae bacterium]|nr:threonine--tRNA ligase [Defluviitaleaceae bacterium]
MINIILPNGEKKEFEKGITPLEIAKSLSNSLAKSAICAIVNGEVEDLTKSLEEDCSLAIESFNEENAETTRVFWHTTAHVLAQAVKRLYPQAKLTIGPPIEKGFYYDIDIEPPLTNEQLPAIEKEMQNIVKENLELKRFALPREEAINLMEEKNESYKIELINELPDDEEISFYEQGEFIDLCIGKHIPNTGMIKALKLLNVAGAYWRADQNNKQLSRVYGISYPRKSMLDDYLTRLEEARKRDHRKLGRELDLFDIYEEGPGFPFMLPKGMILRNILENFWRDEHEKANYFEIRTPLILDEQLWHTSGHYEKYKENMYFTEIDGEPYGIKPMNCPGALLIYKRKMHSYRDLPLRMGELGLVHRHELSGALHGLMRVRNFTQDDAHVFMTEDQIKGEIIAVINLIDKFYKIFGFTYKVELSTKPENAIGSHEVWERATNALIDALMETGKEYKVNEGDGAFYGPKIDFHLEDCLGRTWQCGTIQLDFQMPDRFELTYIASDGEKKRPVMIHRVIYGSVERFIAILTEHFAGAFPLWISPVQIRVLPVSQNFEGYAKEVYKRLKQEGFRIELDGRNEKIGYKIREAQLQKVNYMLVVGASEQEAKNISVRDRKTNETESFEIDDFVKKLKEEILTKGL